MKLGLRGCGEASRTVGASAARLLETGALQWLPARTLSSVWANLASASRPVVLPRGVPVVGVGGATLGGSYKTPLVLALARAASERGERVAVVAHAYGASRSGLRSWGRRSVPRRVGPADSAATVGDDALWLYRELSPLGVPVVAGGERSAALTLGATLAPRLIVDGLLQTEPQRLALSVLAVDSERPWGAGRCPPAGDLCAPRPALLAAADVVARVASSRRERDGDGVEALGASESSLGANPGSVVEVGSSLLGATDPAGALVPLASLVGRPVGVALAVARPDRVLASLASLGIVPVETRLFRDHETPRPCGLFRGGAVRPEVWLTTPKCATKMGSRYDESPVLVLAHRLTLSPEFVDTVIARAATF